MKEARVYYNDDEGIAVRLQDVPIPKPAAHQVLIKVIVSGTNPKDCKLPKFVSQLNGTNSGDDIAGIVQEIGDDVTEFLTGDRVAAFHEMNTPSGSFAEYAIAWETTTFHLLKHISFEEAATVPLAAMTAAVGLFYHLGLPEPWEKRAESLAREKSKGGVVVYNAAGAVGAFAVKLLAWANIHPIIAVAGAGIPFVETLIDRAKGDVLLDYRQGPEDLAAAIQLAIPQGRKLCYAFDAVSEKGSYETISRVLSHDDDSHLSLVLPITNDKEIPPLSTGQSPWLAACMVTPTTLVTSAFAGSDYSARVSSKAGCRPIHMKSFRVD